MRSAKPHREQRRRSAPASISCGVLVGRRRDLVPHACSCATSSDERVRGRRHDAGLAARLGAHERARAVEGARSRCRATRGPRGCATPAPSSASAIVAERRREDWSTRPVRAARSRGCTCRACRACPTRWSARARARRCGPARAPGRCGSASGVAARGDEQVVGVRAVGDGRRLLLERERRRRRASRRRCCGACRRRRRPRRWPTRSAAARSHESAR